MKTYYCVIPHATRHLVLLSKRGGRWSLPRVEGVEGWLSYAVGHIAREVARRWGLEVSFLRELEDRGLNVCELENHAARDEPPPQGARWVGREELEELRVAEAQREVLRGWFEETRLGVSPRLRPEWEHRGWLAEAKGWIAERLEELQMPAAGPVVQYKAAWACSAVLLVPTAKGDLYFKAGYAKPPGEPAVIRALAEKWPRNVPNIVALDERRRWMLMPDFGGRRMTELAAENWGESLRLFAQIQAGAAAEPERWRGLGCRVLKTAQLSEESETLFSDSGDLNLGRIPGCAPEEIAALRRRAQKVRRWCDELAAYPVPLSLVHEDLRESNIRFAGDTYLYFDWSDTVITHPFFSALRLLDFLRPGDVPGRMTPAKLRRYLRDAYLEPWTSYAPAPSLRKAFDAVRRLNPLYLALRWHVESRYLEADSPWGRHNAETLLRKLREFLAATD